MVTIINVKTRSPLKRWVYGFRDQFTQDKVSKKLYTNLWFATLFGVLALQVRDQSQHQSM